MVVRWHPLDRLLHPGRRRRAIARLRGTVPSGTVLFVCYGNICRSPFAAAAFLRALRGPAAAAYQARSAGFTGLDRPSPGDAIASAERLGIDLSGHRSTLIAPDLVRRAVLIVVMSADQARQIRARFQPAAPMLVLGDLDPLAASARTIRDPWRREPRVFDQTYDRIERCVGALADLLSR